MKSSFTEFLPLQTRGHHFVEELTEQAVGLTVLPVAFETVNRLWGNHEPRRDSDGSAFSTRLWKSRGGRGGGQVIFGARVQPSIALRKLTNRKIGGEIM